jgi:hypothetical protein
MTPLAFQNSGWNPVSRKGGQACYVAILFGVW